MPKDTSAHHHKRIHEPRPLRRHAEPARRREPPPSLRAPARAGAQRDGPRARDGDSAVARLDAPREAPRGRVRARPPGRASTRSTSSPTSTLPGTAKAVLDEAASSADPTLEGDQRRLLELDAEQRGALPESFAGEMHRHYSPGRTWESLASGIAALLRLGDVLDVGSGDGAAAAYLAPYCRSLVCIDTSARMVDAARSASRRTPTSARRWPTCTSSPFARRRSTPSSSFTRSRTPSTRSGPSRSARACSARAAASCVLSLDKHEQTRGHRALRRAPRRLLAADPPRHALARGARRHLLRHRLSRGQEAALPGRAGRSPRSPSPGLRKRHQVVRCPCPPSERPSPRSSSSVAASPSSTAPWARPSAPTG